jgi:hypothetical protein
MCHREELSSEHVLGAINLYMYTNVCYSVVG